MEVWDIVYFNTTQTDTIKSIYNCEITNKKFLWICWVLINEKDILKYNTYNNGSN